MVRTLLTAAAAIAATLGLIAGAPAHAAEKLSVYTAFENEQLAPYKKAFEAAYPDYEIQWVRDSTGIITARLLAEKDNPQADVIWGLAASSLLLFEQYGMLEGYAPKGLDNIKPTSARSKSPPTWVGNDAWMAAVCYNTIEGEKQNLPKPEAWPDLAEAGLHRPARLCPTRPRPEPVSSPFPVGCRRWAKRPPGRTWTS